MKVTGVPEFHEVAWRARIGFEIFRFEGEKAIEHWDNIQHRLGPNFSGHTMVDGVTDATELDCTEVNRDIVRYFVNEVLINGQFDKLENYINEASYTEHNPCLDDDVSSLSSLFKGGTIYYEKNHRILAEGNFVLSVCEGSVNDLHSSFYDLFRLSDGKLVEHWDTTEAIPPRDKWKNENGKF